jgi:putative spermidine/putrescine transport system permease protein
MSSEPVGRSVVNAPRVARATRGRLVSRARRSLAWTFLPFALLTGAVVVAPLVTIVHYAFQHGLSDWSAFLHSPPQVASVVRTLGIAAETTVLCALLGYVYAGVLVRASGRARVVLLAAVSVPFLTSILIRTYGWIVLLGPNGPINWFLRNVGLGSAALLYNRTGLMIGMVHVMLPVFVLPLYAVWRQVPPNLSRASRTLGANAVEAFVRIELPLTLPGAAAGGILVFITSLGFFVTPSLLGGNSDTMVSQLIDQQVNISLNINAAAVLATVLIVAVFAIVGVFRLVYPIEALFLPQQAPRADTRACSRRRPRITLPPAVSARALSARLRITNAVSALPWLTVSRGLTGLTAVYLILPVLIVIPIAFSGAAYLTFPPHSWSLQWFHQILTSATWRQAAINTLITGAIATAVAAVVGIPLAFGLVRSRLSSRFKAVVMLIATIPAITPVIVLALGVYVWYLEEHLLANRVALAAAHAVLGLPFLLVVVMAGLRDYDQRLDRAARSLGADARRTLRYITLPVLKASLVAGLLLAFLQSFDELLIARAVTNAQTATLPVQMWNGANQDISPALGAVSVFLLAVTLLGAVVVAATRRRPTGVA